MNTNLHLFIHITLEIYSLDKASKMQSNKK